MNDLITLEEYKDSQGIRSPNEDLRIAALITSVSQLVKTYCNNSFVDYLDVPRTELLTAPYGACVVYPIETPLIEVVSVEEREGPNSAFQELTTEDYYVSYDEDAIYRIFSNGTPRRWSNKPGSIKLIYKAGFAVIPEDLKLAVISLVTYYLKDEHKPRQTISGATRENSSQNVRIAPGFPDHIRRILELYKNY